MAGKTKHNRELPAELAGDGATSLQLKNALKYAQFFAAGSLHGELPAG